MSDPHLSWNLVSDLRALFDYPFMVNALEAGTLVAILAGAVGWFVVLRRQAFAAHTLSVMAFPGAAGAVLAGLPVAAGYYLACTAASLVVGASGGPRRAGGARRESATVGTVQAAGLALGYLFLSLGHGVLTGLETLLFGTFLGISRGQVLTLLLLTAGVLAVLVAIGRPLRFATVDAEVAGARRVRVRALEVGFLVLLAVTVAATSQITGALLVFALLVAPPATASLVTARPGAGLALSVAIGVLVTWVGLGLAYFSVYPVGFFVTATAFVLYAVVLVAVRIGRR